DVSSSDLDVLMSCRTDLCLHRSVLLKAYHLHRLRQVNITPSRVLLIDRGKHQLIAKKQLILHLSGILIVRIIKGQRAEHHFAAERRFHIFTVKIRDKPVSQSDHMPESCCISKPVDFLLPCSRGGMVPHERRENAELQPAHQKFLCRICAESAQIRSCIEETAHIQRRHHLDI